MSALVNLSPVYRHCLLLTRNVNYLKKSFSKKPANSLRSYTKNAWEMDTNVNKDVVLYAHHNPLFHKYMNIFAITQFGFWIYLAEFSISTLRDAPVEKKEADTNQPWYRNINLGENKYRRGITTLCIAVGKWINWLCHASTQHIKTYHIWNMFRYSYFGWKLDVLLEINKKYYSTERRERCDTYNLCSL